MPSIQDPVCFHRLIFDIQLRISENFLRQKNPVIFQPPHGYEIRMPIQLPHLSAGSWCQSPGALNTYIRLNLHRYTWGRHLNNFMCVSQSWYDPIFIPFPAKDLCQLSKDVENTKRQYRSTTACKWQNQAYCDCKLSQLEGIQANMNKIHDLLQVQIKYLLPNT